MFAKLTGWDQRYTFNDVIAPRPREGEKFVER